jgi:hypothetical protein
MAMLPSLLIGSPQPADTGRGERCESLTFFFKKQSNQGLAALAPPAPNGGTPQRADTTLQSAGSGEQGS